jgi:hypothetical protein
VTLTDRDRKIVIAIVPLLILLGYWFLLLSPKRQDATRLGDDLAKQEQKRDELNAEVEKLNRDRKSFASDYSTVVELGKAVPTTVDMPSLIVQLQRAASGTSIQFDRIHADDRIPASGAGNSGSGSASGGTSTASSSGSGSTPPASAAGGQKAGTGQGRAVEKANETKQSQDQQAQSTSSTGGTNGTPGATGSTGAGAGGQQTSGTPGLDAVPLEFTFVGSFFDLADFYHRMKRFVWVANRGRVAVHGRLLAVDGFDLKASDKGFPQLEAQVFATVYLTPTSEGATGGATPSGPAATPASGTRPAGSTPPAPSTQPPAATATSR